MRENIDFENLARRLDRVERQNSRLKRLWGGTMLLVAALTFMGQVPQRAQKEIEAERFTLRDAKGTTRASWGLSTDNALVMGINDSTGKTRLTLGVEPNGSPSFDLRGKDGTRRFILFVKGDDRPELALFDDQGKRRVGLVSDSKSRTAGLVLSDAAERTRTSLVLGDDGLASLVLVNRNQKPELTLGESKTGPMLVMNDSQGNERIGVGIFSVGPTLRFWTQDGSVIRAIP